MKRLILFCAALLTGAAAFSQTIFTYGNSAVDKDEFLRAYNKNKPAVTDKDKAVRDYLDLYINFKLKVKAAEQLHLDTLSQIRYDTQNFRDQISPNYLADEKGMNDLVTEAASRGREDRHVVYFSIAVPAGSSPADTMKAFRAATELYKALGSGNADYAAAVTDISEKYAAVKYADAGFVTVFSVPYDLENIIYNTPPGTVSMPYRTERGWLLFKVAAQRADGGKWKAAQILFAYPPNADYGTKLAVKEKADSVYRLLQQGLAFDVAAKQFSDDRMTYLAGGELPEFTTGKYTPSFENHIFALANDNDISAPFETDFGYHIVKRLSHTSLPADLNDASRLAEIRQRVQQDSRINAEKEMFAAETSARTGFKRNAAVTDAELLRYADTIKNNLSADLEEKLPVSKKTIISFRDGTQVKGDEWLRFVKNNSSTETVSKADRQLLKSFTTQEVLNYYKNHLENYNADFKYQMQEFKEGNMLFEIMERNVWSEAGKDSVRLVNYYNAHKENYKWENSADVLIINCSDEKEALAAIGKLRNGLSWQALAAESSNRIQADSGRYEISQIPGNPDGSPKSGAFSGIIRNSDGTAAFVKYITVYPPNMQRSFTEARGLVINDYQNVIEQEWVAALRKKYPVKVNEAVVQQVINQ